MRGGLLMSWAAAAWLVWAPALAHAQQPTFTPAPPATPPTAPPLAVPAPQTPEPAARAPAAAVDPTPAPDERAAAVSPATPSPPPAIEPEVPPPALLPPRQLQLPRRRLYGDAGTMELALALGYTKQTGFVGGGGFRRFVLDGVGPGLEASIQKSDTQTTGLLLASLKLVPLRGEAAALVLTGRAGRVLLSDHDDGWGAGVGAGVILFFSGTRSCG
jgi:hypothetical protein